MNMLKYIYVLCAVFLISCTGTYEKNQARMDELYGCKKPGENLSKEKYKACLAKERASGDSLFDLEGNLNDLIRGKDNVVYQYTVNPYLWRAAIEVTNTYPLKIADNQGGYIQTEWINNAEDNSIRCLIKIQILSKELITTGISSNFLCENKLNETWSSDNIDYIEEEKQITLKILEVAGKLEKANS